jgi:hypothetical protein
MIQILTIPTTRCIPPSYEDVLLFNVGSKARSLHQSPRVRPRNPPSVLFITGETYKFKQNLIKTKLKQKAKAAGEDGVVLVVAWRLVLWGSAGALATSASARAGLIIVGGEVDEVAG